MYVLFLFYSALDDFRIRMIETKSSDEMAKPVYDTLQKRYNFGHNVNALKFRQLYNAGGNYRGMNLMMAIFCLVLNIISILNLKYILNS